MGFFSQGCVEIFHTQSRVDELTKKLDQLTSSQTLFVPDAQGFRRKMKFASGQVFERTFKLGLQALGGHIANGRVAVATDTSKILNLLRQTQAHSKHRIIGCPSSNVIHLFTQPSSAQQAGQSVG